MEDLVTAATTSPDLRALLERAFSGRRVLVTGHTGFVGSWLSLALHACGAEVFGLALAAEQGSLYQSAALDAVVTSTIADIRDPLAAKRSVETARPEIVFHLAAQAFVLESYVDPVETFATNVMGTAHVLDALRGEQSVGACVIVTSDKCYATGANAHTESDPLGGDDPYSASKSAAEMVAHAYASSFPAVMPPIATARAGNIVGGGDWSPDRIIPDLVRAVREDVPLRLRRPDAVRPWQHVLDAITGYLQLADALLAMPERAVGPWNFGPPHAAAETVGGFVEAMIGRWRARGTTIPNPVIDAATVPERTILTLDSTRANAELGWRSALDLTTTVDLTVDWYADCLDDPSFDALSTTTRQWADYVAMLSNAPSEATA